MAKPSKAKAKKSSAARSRKKPASAKAKAAKKPAKRKAIKKTAKAKAPARPKAKVAKKTRRAAPRKSKAEKAHETLVANAQHALELKNAAPKPFRPESRTSHHGMTPLPNQTIAPAGAIEAEEAYAARERAHKSG